MPTKKSGSTTKPQPNAKPALTFDGVFRKAAESSSIIVLEDDIAAKIIVTVDNLSGRIIVATVDNISGRVSQKNLSRNAKAELDAEIARFYKYLVGLAGSKSTSAKASSASKTKKSTKRKK